MTLLASPSSPPSSVMPPTPLSARPLRIWLLRDCEPLPFTLEVRQMRAGRLAQALAARGHQVTWWASTFDHFGKKRVADGDETRMLPSGVRLKLMECGTYQRNLSLARLRHHARLGRRFRELAAGELLPDIIVATFPTIELATEGVRFANAHTLASIVDIRDMWPDSFCDVLPPVLSPFIRLATTHLQRQTRQCFTDATALVASNHHFQHWAYGKTGRPLPKEGVFFLGTEVPTSSHEKVPLTVEETKILDGRVVFVCLGSFGKAYDFAPLIEVAQWCEGNLPQAFFIFAGAGEQWEQVRGSLAGRSNCWVRGWQNRAQTFQLMEASHVALMPCKLNTVPNRFCEALAWGKPVIPSGPENCEMKQLCDTWQVGDFFSTGDTDAFKKIVVEMVITPQRRQTLGENALRLYREHFDVHTVTEKFADYVEKIYLEKRATRGAPLL